MSTNGSALDVRAIVAVQLHDGWHEIEVEWADIEGVHGHRSPAIYPAETFPLFRGPTITFTKDGFNNEYFTVPVSEIRGIRYSYDREDEMVERDAEVAEVVKAIKAKRATPTPPPPPAWAATPEPVSS